MRDTPDRDHPTNADLLDRSLDAVSAGQTPDPSTDALGPELLATIDTLWTMHARSTPPEPDLAFVARLREDLMHASMPLPAPGHVRQETERAGISPSRFRMPIRTTQGVGVFSTVITIAVVVALVATTLGWWDRVGSPSLPTPSEVAFGAATPPSLSGGTSVPSTPTAAIDTPPISTAGDPGRSWTLSDTNPRTDGAPRQITADTNFSVTSALVVGDSIIVSGNDTTSQYGMGSIRRIDLRTGTTLWSVPAKPWGELAAEGNQLYTFTLDPKRVTNLHLRVSAFSLSTGEEVWTGPELGPGTDAVGSEGPILLDGMLFATDPAGNTLALDPTTGKKQWQFPETANVLPVTSVAPSSMVAVHGDTEPWVFVTTPDHSIVRLSGLTGEVRAITDTHGDAQFLSLTAADNQHLFVQFSPSVESKTGQKGVGIDRLTAANLTSEGTLEGFDSAANVIPEPGGALLMFLGTYTEFVRILPSEAQQNQFGENATINVFPLPDLRAISLAGQTVMGVGANGEIAFINTETRKVEKTAIPVAVPRTTGSLPPLLWHDAPLVVTNDGAIWVLDGTRESNAIDVPSWALAFDDSGFGSAIFTAHAGKDGIIKFALRNDGSKPHSIVIPALGVDASVPPNTSIFLERPMIDIGMYAVFARTATGIDPSPGFFAQLSVGGTSAPRSQFPGIIGVGSTSPRQQITPGTTIFAMPTDQSFGFGSYPEGTVVMPLMVGDPPSDGIATVTDKDGTAWTLVAQGTNTIGWVHSDSLIPLESDAGLRPTPTANAMATPQPELGSLNPSSTTLHISVDLDGVLAGDSLALHHLDAELLRVFTPYVQAGSCEIGFVLVSTRAPDIESGIKGSDVVVNRMTATLPDLIPTGEGGGRQLISESISLPDARPFGEVQLQVFTNPGCTVSAPTR